jgi:hypothetical protein
MLKVKDITVAEALLATLLVATVAALAVVGSMLLSIPKAGANTTDTNGRYVVTNDPTTKITTIKVRNADCLDFEDAAGTLKVVRNGYEPSNGTITYRCVNP